MVHSSVAAAREKVAGEVISSLPPCPSLTQNVQAAGSTATGEANTDVGIPR